MHLYDEKQWGIFLRLLQTDVQTELGVRFLFGAEVEFYLLRRTRSLSKNDEMLICERLFSKGLEIERLAPESHPRQYEVSFAPSTDLPLLAERIHKLRLLLKEICEEIGCEASFLAKPVADGPGSGMHFHLHIEDHSGSRLFRLSENSNFTNEIYFAIEGLCRTMNEGMIFFAPSQVDYDRISRQPTDPEYRFSCAPKTISWGLNNRTCAIRIPYQTIQESSTRLEHRLSAASCNPFAAISAILGGCAIGIRERLALSFVRCFADARDDLGGTLNIARSFDDAVRVYSKSLILHNELFEGRSQFLELLEPDVLSFIPIE